jgi:hypothetical protein
MSLENGAKRQHLDREKHLVVAQEQSAQPVFQMDPVSALAGLFDGALGVPKVQPMVLSFEGFIPQPLPVPSFAAAAEPIKADDLDLLQPLTLKRARNDDLPSFGRLFDDSDERLAERNIFRPKRNSKKENEDVDMAKNKL